MERIAALTERHIRYWLEADDTRRRSACREGWIFLCGAYLPCRFLRVCWYSLLGSREWRTSAADDARVSTVLSVVSGQLCRGKREIGLVKGAYRLVSTWSLLLDIKVCPKGVVYTCRWCPGQCSLSVCMFQYCIFSVSLFPPLSLSRSKFCAWQARGRPHVHIVEWNEIIKIRGRTRECSLHSVLCPQKS